MGSPKIDDPDLPLVVLFAHWPATLQVFLRHGMGCVGCPITPFHTVIDACVEYRQDEARFRVALAAAVLADHDNPE